MERSAVGNLPAFDFLRRCLGEEPLDLDFLGVIP